VRHTPGTTAFERQVFANAAHAGLRGSYPRRPTRRALLTRLTHAALLAAGLGLTIACDRLPGQARRVPRVGYVANQALPGNQRQDAQNQAVIDGLADYGYIPGPNFQMESRFPTDDSQNAEMISGLLRSRVDVLVTGGTAATVTAKQATATVPIVGVYVGDPVGTGLVQSLARPGGNVTAIGNGNTEIMGKALELLLKLEPTLRRVAYLYNPANASHVTVMGQLSTLAAASGLEAVPAPTLAMADLDVAFDKAVANGAEAFMWSGFLQAQGDVRVAALASSRHLISMGLDRSYPVAGGLISYGPVALAIFRRAGYYVDRILKGAKPADLPVELPTTYELIVNQTTASALGITIPDEVAQQVTSWI